MNKLIVICLFCGVSFTIKVLTDCTVTSILLLVLITLVTLIIQAEKTSAKEKLTQHIALLDLVNPFKRQKVWKDEASLPESIRRNVERKISQFATFDATDTACLQNFNVIKQNTECVFAKKANLWGSSPWLQDLSIEENVVRLLPTFLKFTMLCEPLGLDGFVVELPAGLSSDLQVFGETVRRVLWAISAADPIKVHCMAKSYMSKRGWVFEFNKCTFFITSFAPFYAATHARYAFDCKCGYILFQPEVSFARRDLPPNTAHTNWEQPRTVRDKIRVAYANAHRPFRILPDVRYPMAYDVVMPLANDGVCYDWWTPRNI